MAEKKFLYKIADWLEDSWSQLIMAIIVLLIAILKLFDFKVATSCQVFLIISLLIGYIIGFVYNQNRQKLKASLESELEVEKQRVVQLSDSVERWKKGFDEYFKHSLIFLSNSLGYGVNERISIYEEDLESSSFVLVGRYSNNPLYNKPGRDKYPKDEGYVALGWTGNEFCQGTLPDPNENFEEYVAAIQADCKISKGTIQSLSMKSRSYCVHDITKPVTHEKIGVIVLESTDSEKFNGDEAAEVSLKINELFYAYLVCKKEC